MRRITRAKSVIVRLDPDLVRERRDALGIKSNDELAEKADMVRSTLQACLSDGPCSAKAMTAIANALQTKVETLKGNQSMAEIEEPELELVPPKDWEIVSIETDCLIAANGVRYQVAKLESKLIKGRFVRGKLYAMLAVVPAKLPGLIECLTRHAKVCLQLQNEPMISRHVDIRRLGRDTAWWVLDEWIDSTPLSTLIDAGVEFTSDTIKSIGTDLLSGLAILHENKIIMRELAPERILMVDGTNNCVLTDFELAKLLDSEISVAGKWKYTSPYRAPEVGNDDPKVQSDLFSWAIIINELLTGKTEINPSELQNVLENESVADLIFKCGKVLYHHRPATVAQVLKTWSRWKPASPK